MEFVFSPFGYKSSTGNRKTRQTSEAHFGCFGASRTGILTYWYPALRLLRKLTRSVWVDYNVIVQHGHLSWVFGRVLNAVWGSPGSQHWDLDALRTGSRWHGVLMAQRVRKNLSNKKKKKNPQTWPSGLILLRRR